MPLWNLLTNRATSMLAHFIKQSMKVRDASAGMWGALLRVCFAFYATVVE